MSMSLVAGHEDVSASLLFQWRKLERQGALMAVSAGEPVVPASELAAARAEISKLQRILGKKTLENEILKEAVELAAEKKLIARSPFASPRTASDGRVPGAGRWTLGVARSNAHTRRARAPGWRDGRRNQEQASDAELLAELRNHILELPSYGYRRACALLNRQHTVNGLQHVNYKHVYRLIAHNGPLLPKAPKCRQSSRLHTGKVAVNANDQRWCSDGFEIHCDSGQTVTATFAKDCFDREIMAWNAWNVSGAVKRTGA